MRKARLLVAVGVLGCGNVVGPDELAGSPPPPGVDPSCTEPVAPLDQVELGPTTSATLLDDMLHLEGVVDGKSTYVVIDVSAEPAELVEERPDLAGGATWTHVYDVYWTRIDGDRLDVIDASDGGHVVLVSSSNIDATSRPAIVGTAGSAAFTCVGSNEGDAAILTRIDLSDPTSPSLGEEEHACELYGDNSDADGSLWMEWGVQDQTASVALLDLDQPGAPTIVSHGFATDGVHQYGAITAVESDGEVVAATIDNAAYALLLYRGDAPAGVGEPASFVMSSLGAGDKQLLEVVDGKALVLVPRADGGLAVIAFDVSDPPAWETPAPPFTMDVLLQGTTGSLGDFSALTHDDHRVVVSDGAQIYLVAVGGEAPVDPFVVARQGAAPPKCP